MDKEQQLIISEIFRVFLSEENKSLVQKLSASTSDFIFLQTISSKLKSMQNGFLFSEQPQMIENVLLERLSVPKTLIFEYLLNCYFKAGNELNKGNNAGDKLNKVVTEALEIIKNYLLLTITTPEMFEGCVFEVRTQLFGHVKSNGNTVMEKARQALYLISEINDPGFTSELLENFADNKEFLYGIFKLFYQELPHLIIFNADVQTLLDLFNHLCGSRVFKLLVVENFRMSAVQNGQNLESKPVFSLFFTRSLLPIHGDPLLKEFESKAIDRIKSCKTKNAYLKTCEVM